MLLRKLRNHLIVLGALLLVIGGLFLLDYLNQPQAYTAEDLGLPVEKVTEARELRFATYKGELQLKRTEAGWEVNGKEADAAKVDDFLAALKEISVDAYLGEAEERLAEFSLDERSRTALTLVFADGTTYTAYFGRVGPTLHSRYLQPAGQNKVFLVSGGFTSDITTDEVEWRQKRVLAPVDKIVSLTVEATTTAYTVDFTESKATVEVEGEKLVLTGSELEKFRLALEGVRADDFIDTPTEEQREKLAEAPVVVTVVYQDGQSVELAAYPQDADYYVVSRSDKEWLYLVPYFNVEVFRSDPRDEYGAAQ